MNKCLQSYQWMVLAKMIERYGSIKDSFEILSQMYPECTRIQEVMVALDQGKKLSSILGKDAFEKQLAFYSDYLPLHIAITVVYQKKNENKELEKQISGNMTYQIILLVSSFALMVLFMDVVLPEMMSSLEIENATTSSLIVTFKILKTGMNILIVLLTLITALLFYFYFTKRMSYLWVFFHQYHKDQIFQTIATYFLVNNLLLLLGNGIALKDSLDILRFNKENQLSGLLAFHFHHSLNDGIDFQNSLNNEYFDPQFHAICMFGLRDDDFMTSLQDYKEIIEVKMQQMIKKYTLLLQIACYGFVAIVIVLAYQVLMIPLEMLEGF